MSETGLPRVKIYFENGAIGGSDAIDDRVCGLVASAVAVSTTFVLDKAYQITSLADLTTLGVTAANNDRLYKEVSEFYTEAPIGSIMWIMGVADTLKVSEILDKDKAHAATLIESAKGAITYLIVAKKGNDSVTAVSGLDPDVPVAITNGQALAKYYTESLYAPFFIIIEGRHYTGVPNDLALLSGRTDNRVGVLIADTVSGSNGACVGLLAGRIAAIPVQRSIARVKTGAIGVDTLYVGSVAPENAKPDTIHDAGYITARTFVGKTGYYWSDDTLATSATDDYQMIPRRSVIDKAYRIAYQTLANELSDEIPVTDANTIPAAICKNIQNSVETAIENNMTAYGNLGNDPSDATDIGVECYIDETQNIVSSSKLTVTLRVKPYGYAKYIDLYLGFKTATT